VSLVRVQSEYVYKSEAGGQAYYFTINVSEHGLVQVQSAVTPTGDSYPIPESVLEDMNTARGLISGLTAETSINTGTAAFAAATSAEVTFGVPLNNTDYFVSYTLDPDTGVASTSAKTINGFTINTSAEYTGNVGYVVFQRASGTGALSGLVEFNAASAGGEEITFLSAFPTADYKVVVSKDGFYTVRVTNKTSLGFTLEMGHVLINDETAIVGYDVFV
jgi:hypothetical protein